MKILYRKVFVIIIIIVLTFICLYKTYRKENFSLSPDKLLASIPEQQIYLYYDKQIAVPTSTEINNYHGAYLKIKSQTLYFPWEYQSDIYWPVELQLLNSDQHLAIRLVNDSGNFQFSSSVHIIDINTLQEIPVETLHENLKNHFIIEEFNPKNGSIRFHCLGKSISLDVEPHYFNIDIFPSISYDSDFLYDFSDTGLICTTNLWISPSFCIGKMKIIYSMEDNIYKMNSMEFIP